MASEGNLTSIRSAIALAEAAAPALSQLIETSSGREWYAELPGLIDAARRRWSLDVGPPFPDGSLSFVAPATTSTGDAAVLKVGWPHREADHEPAALRHWAGNGAARLLDEAPGTMLIERCVPGQKLTGRPHGEVLAVLADLLPRLWISADGPYHCVRDEARRWASNLEESWRRAGTPFERELIDDATARLRALARTAGETVLVHQDLHGGNVLSAARMPWLVIDPKPLLGEREFAVASIVRAPEFGHSPGSMWARLDDLVSALGLDRDRTIGWTIGHTLAWAFDGGRVHPAHLDVVRWLRAG